MSQVFISKDLWCADEDILLITETGCEVLTLAPKELIVLKVHTFFLTSYLDRDEEKTEMNCSNSSPQTSYLEPCPFPGYRNHNNKHERSKGEFGSGWIRAILSSQKEKIAVWENQIVCYNKSNLFLKRGNKTWSKCKLKVVTTFETAAENWSAFWS